MTLHLDNERRIATRFGGDLTGNAARPLHRHPGPGSGKTLPAMEFLVRGATEFGEPGVFVAYEETATELTANVASLGFGLDQLVEQGRIAIDHVTIDHDDLAETLALIERVPIVTRTRASRGPGERTGAHRAVGWRKSAG